jgi:hypothetical protein
MASTLPGLTPLHYFLLGCLQEKVCIIKVHNREDLVYYIQEAAKDTQADV